MAANELLTNRLCNVAQGELTGLIGNHGLHQHLQQDIAKFLAKLGD